MPASRGQAISAYSPAFSKGALIYGANIQSAVVTSAHIADGTVLAAEVAAGAITSAKIGTGAVTSIKLAAAAVISAKIGVSAVQNTNIAVNAIRKGAISAAQVTSAKIGVSAVGNTNIKANAIRAGAISARAVTSAKLFAAYLSGTISGLLSGVVAVAHGLATTPKFVIVQMKASHANIIDMAKGVSAQGVFVSQASASTSTNIYLKTVRSGNVNYVAYVQV